VTRADRALQERIAALLLQPAKVTHLITADTNGKLPVEDDRSTEVEQSVKM
jgi:hypothetical protein